MITHIVMMSFSEENKAENIETARERLLSMVGKVEPLRHLEVGLNVVDSPRACDLVLVTRFADLEGLKAYSDDPYHSDIKKFLFSVTESTHVVDYESAD